MLVGALIGGTASAAVAAEISSTFIADADAQVANPLHDKPWDGRAARRLRVDPDVETYIRFTTSGLVPNVLGATLRI